MTTDTSALGRGLVERLGVDRVRFAAPLAPLTTFKVGGPADILVRVDSVRISRVVTMAAAASVPVHVIGGGSNLLVSDAGVRGVVLRLELTRIEQTAIGARVPDAAGADAPGGEKDGFAPAPA